MESRKRRGKTMERGGRRGEDEGEGRKKKRRGKTKERGGRRGGGKRRRGKAEEEGRGRRRRGEEGVSALPALRRPVESP